MIEKNKIEELVNEYFRGTDLFLVDVRVSTSNKIIVIADRRQGITIDDCALISRHIEKGLDRDVEDFDLQVSSPGLEMPFMVIEQYYKNEGRKVTVSDTDGEIFTGTLRNVTSGGFDLETEVRIKGKAKEKKLLPFNFDQVRSVRILLTIK